MDPAALRAAIAHTANKGVHGVQRGPVSLTQLTEIGSAHSLDEIRALTAVAGEFGLRSYMDGARLANAIAHLGCRIRDKLAVGDHILYAATVESARAVTGAKPYVHVRKTGLSY